MLTINYIPWASSYFSHYLLALTMLVFDCIFLLSEPLNFDYSCRFIINIKFLVFYGKNKPNSRLLILFLPSILCSTDNTNIGALFGVLKFWKPLKTVTTCAYKFFLYFFPKKLTYSVFRALKCFGCHMEIFIWGLTGSSYFLNDVS